MKDWLQKHAGMAWSGQGELWMDPEGNSATTYSCSLRISTTQIDYSWEFKGEEKLGRFTPTEQGMKWVDSWHQPDGASCIQTPDALGIFNVYHSYEVPNNPSWWWRSQLSQRPDGALVLQMTNITPWGEEGRAVRMVFSEHE